MSWLADPGELLAGPRGRRLCLSLLDRGGRSPFWVPDGPAWNAIKRGSRLFETGALAADLAAAVGHADLAALAASADQADLAT
jgi:hypothetical protein